MAATTGLVAEDTEEEVVVGVVACSISSSATARVGSNRAPPAPLSVEELQHVDFNVGVYLARSGY